MKKVSLLLALIMSNFLFGQLRNNSFNLDNNSGDLMLRRYSENDLIWKRALVTTPIELIMNYGGDFSNGILVDGEGLRINKYIQINQASNVNNNSSGIIASSTQGDDFLYDGKYINHYGFGFHDFKDNSSPANGHNAYVSSYWGIDFFSHGQNRLRINHNGYVGIGTVNPDSKLTVKGDIHCEEVLVDLEVPADYVFQKYYTGSSSLKEDYTMPTLEEIETFTKENHHLPNVPSAKKIQEGGLQLKEMTNLLLQKIEELTLYTIEQEKRIKALEAQVQATKKKK
ncbi:tail fiber protein [uncultured Tenacibaculum sp.]|uniref:tail fiber protein n=1 Tax=uncultured Tenacibaculum sp. TaxID=174713 RepID=UPI002610D1F7|nr:tail fiber protein [uncultured Tenacibaculum sp.]